MEQMTKGQQRQSLPHPNPSGIVSSFGPANQNTSSSPPFERLCLRFVRKLYATVGIRWLPHLYLKAPGLGFPNHRLPSYNRHVSILSCTSCYPWWSRWRSRDGRVLLLARKTFHRNICISGSRFCKWGSSRQWERLFEQSDKHTVLRCIWITHTVDIQLSTSAELLHSHYQLLHGPL